MLDMGLKVIRSDKDIVHIALCVFVMVLKEFIHELLHMRRASASSCRRDIPPLLTAVTDCGSLPSIFHSEVQLIERFLQVDQSDVVFAFDTAGDVFLLRQG